MHYYKTGTGPALVLLHGFPDSGAIWGGISGALSANFTVIIPDLPGAGKTPLDAPTTLAEMAYALKKVLDAEHISNAVIAGHSMGGYTALAFARQYPEMVSGLSLIHSTAAADDEEKKKTRQKAIEIIRNGGKTALITQMVANLFAPAYREANPETVKAKVAAGMQMSDEGMINFYEAMMARADNSEVLKNATFPVQWHIGRHDAIINYKKNLKECHQSPINFVTLYTDCGHITILEDPAALVTNLSMFATYCCQ